MSSSHLACRLCTFVWVMLALYMNFVERRLAHVQTHIYYVIQTAQHTFL